MRKWWEVRRKKGDDIHTLWMPLILHGLEHKIGKALGNWLFRSIYKFVKYYRATYVLIWGTPPYITLPTSILGWSPPPIILSLNSVYLSTFLTSILRQNANLTFLWQIYMLIIHNFVFQFVSLSFFVHFFTSSIF